MSAEELFVVYNCFITGKHYTFTKLSMRNGRCEHRLCARAPRARQDSCWIW